MSRIETRRREPRAYAGGTFDLFHAGHVRFFEQVRAKFGRLTVALNTDDFAARYKRRPIMTLDERITLVGACRFVDDVTVNDGDEDSTIAITRVRPTVIVHGDDWTGEALMRQMRVTPEFLRAHGIVMAYVPYTPGISSGNLLARIRVEHA